MRPLRIIHIEDNDDDALLLSRALRHSARPTVFKWFPSAREAIVYLEKATGEAIPDLIFCDLRMPVMTGHDFIRWLRGSKLHTLPVVVLSSSDRMEDIRLAYQLGANSFLIKPLAVNDIRQLVQNAIDFWSHCLLATRPPNPTPAQGEGK